MHILKLTDAQLLEQLNRFRAHNNEPSLNVFSFAGMGWLMHTQHISVVYNTTLKQWKAYYENGISTWADTPERAVLVAYLWRTNQSPHFLVEEAPALKDTRSYMEDGTYGGGS